MQRRNRASSNDETLSLLNSAPTCPRRSLTSRNHVHSFSPYKHMDEFCKTFRESSTETHGASQRYASVAEEFLKRGGHYEAGFCFSYKRITISLQVDEKGGLL